MRVDCLNGYYRFYPENVGDLRVWAQWYTPLVRRDNYYTFEPLAEFKDYAFQGRLANGVLLTKNYAGEPWEVMKANNLTYNIASNKITNKNLITDFLEVDDGLIINSPILPQAYSIVGFVNRLESFTGYWDSRFNVFKLERLEYAGILG